MTGRDGRDGRDGLSGQAGRDGKDGATGAKGEKGNIGETGLSGKPGQKGEKGSCPLRNIRQYVFKDLNEDRDTGILKEVTFRKLYNESALWILWSGSLALVPAYRTACRRWFFTFNGKECQDPATVDAQIYENIHGDNSHRPSPVEGICMDVPKGTLRIGFNIDYCERHDHTGKAYTAYDSVSRILVEEIIIHNDLPEDYKVDDYLDLPPSTTPPTTVAPKGTTTSQKSTLAAHRALPYRPPGK
ncbi:collagen triple helix repeat-containing protein 1 isoform X2 [Lingula anatina]|nr:collagen triple helix repeat-containing protein 1 isoform X2 [Lingula anatina]|eukprot:XP_013404962.1 collagen triple helix repeat-containing protein 1 isoform X2 [Lingula anatina]